ncbi:MAG: glycoside hydrolase family 3 N-terminal domain-containing protein [Bdellovibrionales bacterium]
MKTNHRGAGLTALMRLIFLLAPVACTHLPSAAPPPSDSTGAHFMEGLNGRNFEQVKDDAKNGRIGAVIVFASAFRDAEDLRAKIAAIRAVAPRKLVFAMDGEGGKVLRLPGIEAAGADEMGVKGNEFTFHEATKIAHSLRALGIDLNLAPVVDLAVYEKNSLAAAGRCFSPNAHAVAARAREFIRAHSLERVKTTLKHFPGHGSSRVDSHQDWADISATWHEEELLPYQEIIGGGFDGAVMVGHLFNRALDEEFPASLSKLTIQTQLREKLGFKGVVITDDLQMGAVRHHYPLHEAVRLALNAGNDFILIGQQYRNDELEELETWLFEEIRSGNISAEWLSQSLLRLQSL